MCIVERLKECPWPEATSSRTVAMNLTAAPGQGFFASDVLSLVGTAGDAIVLSLTYDPAALGSQAASSLGAWVRQVRAASVA